MNTTVDLKAVNQFLKIAKKNIVKNNYILVPRNDINIGTKTVNYKQALLDLSTTPIGAKEKILELDPNECFNVGWDYDKTRDLNCEIFEFSTKVNGIITYIKLTMNDKMILCLGFHRSRFH